MSQEVACSSCGKAEFGHIRCPGGHYLCDTCHNKDSLVFIHDIARTTTSRNPFEIADAMLNLPGLPMLGCQHAYIAGAALIAAVKNEGSRGVTAAAVDEVFTRTEKQARGGFCGLSGVCGIAPAVGAVFSVLTGSRCGTDGEQRITMEAVTRVARAITDLTGPSCCKAYVWGALDVAVQYLKEGLGIVLPGHDPIACHFTHKHPHGCREERCPYFAGVKDSQIPVKSMESLLL